MSRAKVNTSKQTTIEVNSEAVVEEKNETDVMKNENAQAVLSGDNSTD